VLGFTLAGARTELIRQEMTIEDYNNVIRIFTFKSYFPSAKEVEDELKKLGYKIIKL
jgi:hypothetical protein